jgi:ferritin-like metal-binding protein YciE
METLKSMKVQSGFERDEFESALLAELVELRRSEKALQKMYPRLKSKPQLRTRFLQQLAEMQQRTHRLDAVLNPLGALQFAEVVPAPMQSSVA